MAFKNNYVDLINEKLIKCSSDANIEPFTLNTPEHQFKKRTGVFNQAIREVYEERDYVDCKMFHILLSLNQYFELDWLMENILEDDIKSQVREEMIEEYNTDPNREFISSNPQKTSLTLINEAIASISEKAIAFDKRSKELKKIGTEPKKDYPFKPFHPFNVAMLSENQLKTHKHIFNEALRICCDSDDTEMNDLLVGIQEYFNPAWVLNRILDDTNRDYIKEEMQSSYGIDVMKMWEQY